MLLILLQVNLPCEYNLQSQANPSMGMGINAYNTQHTNRQDAKAEGVCESRNRFKSESMPVETAHSHAGSWYPLHCFCFYSHLSKWVVVTILKQSLVWSATAQGFFLSIHQIIMFADDSLPSYNLSVIFVSLASNHYANRVGSHEHTLLRTDFQPSERWWQLQRDYADVSLHFWIIILFGSVKTKKGSLGHPGWCAVMNVVRRESASIVIHSVLTILYLLVCCTQFHTNDSWIISDFRERQTSSVWCPDIPLAVQQLGCQYVM